MARKRAVKIAKKLDRPPPENPPSPDSIEINGSNFKPKRRRNKKMTKR